MSSCQSADSQTPERQAKGCAPQGICIPDESPQALLNVHVGVHRCVDMVYIHTDFFKVFFCFLEYCSNMGLPRWQSGKEFACKAGITGDAGSIPGWERSPGLGNWQPTPVFLLGEFRGQRSLVVYSPWGPEELDTTEQLSTHAYYYIMASIQCMKN